MNAAVNAREFNDNVQYETKYVGRATLRMSFGPLPVLQTLWGKEPFSRRGGLLSRNGLIVPFKRVLFAPGSIRPVPTAV